MREELLKGLSEEQIAKIKSLQEPRRGFEACQRRGHQTH